MYAVDSDADGSAADGAASQAFLNKAAGKDSSGSGSLWGYSVALHDGADKYVAMGAPHAGPNKRGISLGRLMLQRLVMENNCVNYLTVY